MSDVTRILNGVERGDAKATDELLPLLYEELRVLAAQKLSQEKPGQTLQATALVHEAYLRLVGTESQSWNSRGHFFAATASRIWAAGNIVLVECVASGTHLGEWMGIPHSPFHSISPITVVALGTQPILHGYLRHFEDSCLIWPPSLAA